MNEIMYINNKKSSRYKGYVQDRQASFPLELEVSKDNEAPVVIKEEI